MGGNCSSCSVSEFRECNKSYEKEITNIFRYILHKKHKKEHLESLHYTNLKLKKILDSIELNKNDDTDEIREMNFIFNNFLLNEKELLIKYKIPNILEVFDFKKDLFLLTKNLVIKYYSNKFVGDNMFYSELISLNSNLSKLDPNFPKKNEKTLYLTEESLNNSKEFIFIFDELMNFKSIKDPNVFIMKLKGIKGLKRHYKTEFDRIFNLFFGLFVLNKGGYLDNTGKKFWKIYKTQMQDIKNIIHKRSQTQEIINDNFDLYLHIMNKNDHYSSKLDNNDKIDSKFQNTINANMIRIMEKSKSNETQKTYYPSTNKEILGSSNTFMIEKEKQTNNCISFEKYKYFCGDYDTMNLWFSGKGILISPNKYLYEGIFKDGKKSGYGYIFRRYQNNSFEYYLGEWNNNKYNGYGILYNSSPENKLIKKGVFKNGVLIVGQITNILENNTEINIERYKGKIYENQMFSNTGRIYRSSMKKLNNKYYLEFHYFYKGELKNNKENGKGLSVKISPRIGLKYFYKGDFLDGKMEGEGSIIFEGDFFAKKYEGIFNNDKWFSHYGRIYFKEGDYYEGFFDKDNNKSGLGIYINSSYDDRNITNISEVSDYSLNNQIKSYQRFSESDFNEINKKIFSVDLKGDGYFGIFQKDKKEGYGKYLIEMKKMIIVGSYSEGMKNGSFVSISSQKQEQNKVNKVYQTYEFHNDLLKLRYKN